MNFSFNDAYRIINNVIDERINGIIRSGAGVEITWATVAELTSPSEIGVYLYGDAQISRGFKLENGLSVALNDPVRVCMDKRGNRWVDAVIPRYADTQPRLSLDVRNGSVGVGDGTTAPENVLTRANGLKLLRGGIRLGTSAAPTNAPDIGMMFGADIELYRAAANVLALAAGDRFDGSNILADDFASATTSAYTLAANTAMALTNPKPSIIAPSTGNYRVWVMASIIWSHSVTGLAESWVRLGLGTFPIISLQRTFISSAGGNISHTIVGWLDSASAGTDRADSNLTGGVTITAEPYIRAAGAGTATVYADAAAKYVTNCHLWVTRVP